MKDHYVFALAMIFTTISLPYVSLIVSNALCETLPACKQLTIPTFLALPSVISMTIAILMFVWWINKEPDKLVNNTTKDLPT